MTPILMREQRNPIPKTPEFQAIAIGLGLKPGCTFAEFNVRALQINAAKGHGPAIKELWERLEGKVSQPIEGAPNGEPIRIHLVTE